MTLFNFFRLENLEKDTTGSTRMILYYCNKFFQETVFFDSVDRHSSSLAGHSFSSLNTQCCPWDQNSYIFSNFAMMIPLDIKSAGLSVACIYSYLILISEGFFFLNLILNVIYVLDSVSCKYIFYFFLVKTNSESYATAASIANMFCRLVFICDALKASSLSGSSSLASNICLV